MALTTTEQLSIVNGDVKSPESDLLSLILQQSFIFSKSFYDNYKEFEAETYPKGDIYLNKMFSTISKILNCDLKTLDTVKRTLVVIMGENYTIAQVMGANQSQWEGFVSDKISEAIEYTSCIRKDEKIEYNSI